MHLGLVGPCFWELPTAREDLSQGTEAKMTRAPFIEKLFFKLCRKRLRKSKKLFSFWNLKIHLDFKQLNSLAEMLSNFAQIPSLTLPPSNTFGIISHFLGEVLQKCELLLAAVGTHVRIMFVLRLVEPKVVDQCAWVIRKQKDRRSFLTDSYST